MLWRDGLWLWPQVAVRPGAWLGKDHMDHILVSDNEMVRCKAVRKTWEHWNGELLVNAIVGPWDMKRRVHTKVDTKPIPTPTPELLADAPSKPERKKEKRKEVRQIRTLRMCVSMPRSSR